MEISCSKCGNLDTGKGVVRNGVVRNDKQRYECKDCGHTFIEGDSREKISSDGKILAALLYGKGKLSLNDIAKLLNVSKEAVRKSVKNITSKFEEPVKDLQYQKIDPKELSMTITRKCNQYNNNEKWISLEIKPSDDLVAIILLKPLKKM